MSPRPPKRSELRPRGIFGPPITAGRNTTIPELSALPRRDGTWTERIGPGVLLNGSVPPDARAPNRSIPVRRAQGPCWEQQTEKGPHDVVWIFGRGAPQILAQKRCCPSSKLPFQSNEIPWCDSRQRPASMSMAIVTTQLSRNLR